MRYDLPELQIDETYDGYINHQLIDILERDMKDTSNIKLVEDIITDRIGGDVCYDYVFPNDDLECCEDAEEVLQYRYKPVSLKKVKEGDIVAFYNSEVWTEKDQTGKEHTFESHQAVHFGIVVESNGTLAGIRILSKWGIEGVYRTDLTMLPTTYGQTVQFFTERKKVCQR